jgi:hypothetical protein
VFPSRDRDLECARRFVSASRVSVDVRDGKIALSVDVRLGGRARWDFD